MKSISIFLLGSLLVSSAYGQANYNYNKGNRLFSEDVSSNSGDKVPAQCNVVETSPGEFDVVCSAPNNLVLSNEHILWLNVNGSPQRIRVRIPNYKVEELIRAGLKGKQGPTDINVLVDIPERIYNVQADEKLPPRPPPSISLEYDQPPPGASVHFGGEKAYDPLTGEIRDPETRPPGLTVSSYPEVNSGSLASYTKNTGAYPVRRGKRDHSRGFNIEYYKA